MDQAIMQQYPVLTGFAALGVVVAVAVVVYALLNKFNKKAIDDIKKHVGLK